MTAVNMRMRGASGFCHSVRRLGAFGFLLVSLSMCFALARPDSLYAQPVSSAGNVRTVIATPGSSERNRSLVHKVQAKKKKKSGQSIVILVNDDPITAYEIELRQKLLSMSSKRIATGANTRFKAMLKSEKTKTQLRAILKKTIEGNKGKSREEIKEIFNKQRQAFARRLQQRAMNGARAGLLPQFRKTAEKELIDERLKLQAAKQINVAVDNKRVRKVVTGMAKRNKMNYKQFAKHLKTRGVSVSTIESRIKSQLSWNSFVQQKFGREVAISSGHIDRYIDPTILSAADGNAAAELKMQRITLPVSDAGDQAAMSRRLQDAGAMQQAFKGCKSSASVAKSISGAKFEDLGARQSSTIPEPTRSMALNAKSGDMLPPSVGPQGVVVWIVCGKKSSQAVVGGRRPAGAKDKKRRKEFDLLAKRHLKNLRQDAHIEYR